MAQILVVDDDRATLQFMQDSLGREHEVAVAGGGLQGWEKIQNTKFDLLILDWDMPDITGIEVLKRFREAGGTTPVLMLTGRKSDDEKALGLDLGADDYLTKPFSIKELGARIRAALRRNQVVSALPKSLGSGNEELLNRANLMGTALAARYEFIELLGEGAAGIVFKAKNDKLKKMVAIKMLLSGLRDEALGRFEQEARLIGKLDHPGIAAVYDFGITERFQSYMVMEYVDGRTLAAVLKATFNLPVRLSMHLAIRVSESVAHAHGKGIIHRDLKPTNVMIREAQGVAPSTKLLDFGCGKFRDLSAEQGIALTREGSTLGSPPYMSPEQVRGRPVDERSDIYSLGCIIHEMLTGYPPFMGDHPNEIMLKHLDEPPVPLRQTRSDLEFSDRLEAAVAKTLSKDPAQRYQSVPLLIEELKQIATAK